MKLDLRVLKGYHEKIVFGANAGLFQVKLPELCPSSGVSVRITTNIFVKFLVEQ